MDKFKEIRPVVLGVLVRDNKLLVSEGYDKVKNQKFYRCIGGGIEFLERSDVALKREFKEEIGADVFVGNFLGLSENIFTYNGKNGHELVLFYSVSMEDSDFKDEYHILDEVDSRAVWVDVDLFKSNQAIVYPTEVVKYI
jgi:ADP-ribose pyrophosphatase YjhB (NUDIX family)